MENSFLFVLKIIKKQRYKHMALGNQPLNFEKNLLIICTDNRNTDLWQMDDRRISRYWFHGLCWHSPAELKISSCIQSECECLCYWHSAKRNTFNIVHICIPSGVPVVVFLSWTPEGTTENVNKITRNR